MPRFTVYLVTTASTSVEVEAEDSQDAIEKAFDESLPYAPHNAGFDIGDWSLPSELDPANKPEDDWDEIS